MHTKQQMHNINLIFFFFIIVKMAQDMSDFNDLYEKDFFRKN